MPIMREILFAIFCTCGFQLMCSSSVNPKKLNSETRSSGSEFNSSAGTKCSIFLCGWWKIMNLVLLTFTDDLFIRSHSCTHESSLLILAATSERLFEFTELEELKEHNGSSWSGLIKAEPEVSLLMATDENLLLHRPVQVNIHSSNLTKHGFTLRSVYIQS